MAKYLATYDFRDTSPDPRGPFLKQVVKHKWQLWMLIDGKTWYRLPNTTIIGEFDSQSAADAAFDAAVAATSAEIGRPVVVEKYLLVRYDSALITSDKQQAKK